jgi:hypothetical protein
VRDVSNWAGNNRTAQNKILKAPRSRWQAMQEAIADLLDRRREAEGVEALSGLDGIGLVIASKIYRFCAPSDGAAVDRHASYFFNSLPTSGFDMATYFRREWANGRHSASRLAVYTATGHEHNRRELFSTYLPLLRRIAKALNAIPAPYRCAATKQDKSWRPADIEMAAYHWWSRHGAR